MAFRQIPTLVLLLLANATILPVVRGGGVGVSPTGFAARWEYPDDVLPGIELGDMFPRYWVYLDENVGRELDSGFALAKMTLNAPANLTLETSDYDETEPDPRLILVSDESRLVWHLNATTWFDYEAHDLPVSLGPTVYIMTDGPEEEPEYFGAWIIIQDVDDNPPLFCGWEDEPGGPGCSESAQFTFNVTKDYVGGVVGDIWVKDVDEVPAYSRFNASFAEDTPELITSMFEITPGQGVHDQEFQLDKIRQADSAMDVQFVVEMTVTGTGEKAVAQFSGTIY